MSQGQASKMREDAEMDMDMDLEICRPTWAPGQMETKSGQYWLPKWRTRLIQPVAWPLARTDELAFVSST